MMHGNISNQSGYSVAFRCECLVKYKTGGIRNSLLNSLFGKVKRAEIDSTYRDAMEYLYRHTEYTVDLIVMKDDYTQPLKEVLDDMPYNSVVIIEKESQISQRLIIGDITLYVDEDDYRRSLVNSQYAIPIKKLNEFLKRNPKS